MFSKSKLIMRKLTTFFTGLSVLILFSAMSVSVYAWLSSNRNVSSENKTFDLDSDDAVAYYDIYKYDMGVTSSGTVIGGTTKLSEKDSAGNAYLTDIPISITNIDINQYDLIFTKRNRYTPVFARIELTRIEAMPRDGKLTVTITRSPEENMGNKLPTKVSSVLRFTAMVDHGFTLNYNDKTDAEFYQHVDDILYERTLKYSGSEAHDEGDISTYAEDSSSGNFSNSSKNFFSEFSKTTETVTINDKQVEQDVYSYTLTDSITLILDYSDDDWLTNSDGEDIMNIYLYMTYDVGLIDCFKTENDMNVISIGENVFDFENDLKDIQIHCIKDTEGN